eukprot:2472188-Pleurochrysis_carterae.AAC.1
MDHLLNIANWHGGWGQRKARNRKCALPPRADGPPADGFPYRVSAWLRRAHASPELHRSQASLVADSNALASTYPGSFAKSINASWPLHRKFHNIAAHGQLFEHGPVLTLPSRSSDVEIRRALSTARLGQIRMLHV